MDGRKFLDLCIKKVTEHITKRLKLVGDTSDVNVFVVWSCKTLQNNKALLGVEGTGLYYELTYNGDKKELYVDVYLKDNQLVFKNVE